MSNGVYNSIVVVGDNVYKFKKELLTNKLKEKQYDSKWNFLYYDSKDNYANVQEFALNNMESIIPSDEGKIDNPKSITKIN